MKKELIKSVVLNILAYLGAVLSTVVIYTSTLGNEFGYEHGIITRMVVFILPIFLIIWLSDTYKTKGENDYRIFKVFYQ